MSLSPRVLQRLPLHQLFRSSLASSSAARPSTCQILPDNQTFSSCGPRLYSTKLPKLPSVPSKNGPGMKKQFSALKYKSRSGISKKRLTPGKDEWSIVGYSVAESFDILGLLEGLERQRIYCQMPLADDVDHSCLYVTNQLQVDVQTKEIFIFKEGCVVFWNVPELERDSVLRFVKAYGEDCYEDQLIFDESEMMNYCETQNGSSHLKKGVIHVEAGADQLVKYAFSNAIVASVKLGSWEASLDRIIDSIEHISEDMQRNNVKMTLAEVMQKTGEMLALRHMINLSSDLLDTPDFYWDREQLEHIYHQTCSHLAVGKRTQVVNAKLSHCIELMTLIADQLNADHGARLEWIIIILIAIEIGFEVLHVIRN